MQPQSFESLPLKPALLENLGSMGYRQMTPVQAQTLEFILGSQDVIAQAETGSGKTAAFGLGLLNSIDPGVPGIQAAVLCPTRELAEQVATELRRLARRIPNLKVLTLCGGTPIGPQLNSLAHGAHVVVGTPGRVLDHLGRRSMRLARLQTLVVDEADRLMEMGFGEDLDKIVAQLPKRRQTLLFSATFPEDIAGLSESIQKQPRFVKVGSSQQRPAIEQQVYTVAPAQRTSLLLRLLCAQRPQSTLVFCNTKAACQELADQLHQAGLKALAIHGDLLQQDRDITLARFTNRSVSVLVATDVAARGLHVEDLNLVVNYDLPHKPETFTHRIGRTGRAGANGQAISFVGSKQTHRLEDFQIEDQWLKAADQVLKEPVKEAYKPPMITLRIGGGKKNKLRPTDILGALTSSKEVYGNEVGVIKIFDFQTLVAVQRKKAGIATGILKNGKIKGRIFKVALD